jgi:uncharacterized membrane protein
MAGLIGLGVLTYAYRRIGIGAGWMAALLGMALAGSLVNIPVAVVPTRIIHVQVPVRVFGFVYRVPAVLREQGCVVAVNVGGALVPVGVSVYLFFAAGVGWAAVLATALVTVVVFAAARPVPGLGVVTPAIVPPLSAALSALLVGGGPHLAATAYIAGTVGTLVGGDLLSLPRLRQIGAPMLSIGGAGTFDGIFLAGVLGVLLSTI